MKFKKLKNMDVDKGKENKFIIMMIIQIKCKKKKKM